MCVLGEAPTLPFAKPLDGVRQALRQVYLSTQQHERRRLGRNLLHLRISEQYPRRELQPALREAGVTLTEDAGRIELWHTPPDGFLHAMPSPDGPVMPWPWVFADLQRIGGRAAEAAEHLRETMEHQA